MPIPAHLVVVLHCGTMQVNAIIPRISINLLRWWTGSTHFQEPYSPYQRYAVPPLTRLGTPGEGREWMWGGVAPWPSPLWRGESSAHFCHNLFFVYFCKFGQQCLLVYILVWIKQHSSNLSDEITIYSHKNKTRLHWQIKNYVMMTPFYENDTRVNKNCKYYASNKGGGTQISRVDFFGQPYMC